MERVLWKEERKKLLSALKEMPARHRERNRALILIAYDTGCRVSELASLNVQDFDPQRKTLMLINSKAKGHPLREVPIHYRTIRALKAWLRERQDLPDEDAMFVSQKGNRLSIRQMQNIYNQACDVAGIDGKGIHTLRHTSATRLLDDNVLPVHQLSRRLGHRSIQTTYKYYIHQSIEEEAAAIKKSKL